VYVWRSCVCGAGTDSWGGPQVDGRDVFGCQVHSATVTALDYDASTGWMISAADDGVVAVYRETSKVSSLT
jgi:hypothetical protein